jgi:hypothetical protein
VFQIRAHAGAKGVTLDEIVAREERMTHDEGSAGIQGDGNEDQADDR